MARITWGKFSFFSWPWSEIPQTLGAQQGWAAGSVPSRCPGFLPPLHKAVTVAENEGPVTDHLALSPAWHSRGRRNFLSP